MTYITRISHIYLHLFNRIRRYAIKAKSYATNFSFPNIIENPSCDISCDCIVILLVIRSEKEKSKFQAEVYELLAQVENVTKEKHMYSKTVEKLEINISELHIKIEELNRTIVDITSHKQRLSQENIELIKEVQDLKVCRVQTEFHKKMPYFNS